MVFQVYIYILYIIQTGSLTTIMQHLSAVISSVGDPWAPSAKIWRFGFDLRRIFRSCSQVWLSWYKSLSILNTSKHPLETIYTYNIIQLYLHLIETVDGAFNRGMGLTPCVASKAYPYATCEARRELCVHLAQGGWKHQLGSDHLGYNSHWIGFRENFIRKPPYLAVKKHGFQ